jgi:hypothetical protein
MNALFALPKSGSEDPIYARMRDRDQDAALRKEIEQLWIDYKPICPDDDFPLKLQRDFVAMAWQMQLSVFLQRKSYPLVRPHGDSPDICIEGSPKVWIECTAIGPGDPDKPDSVPRLEYGIVKDVPERQVILRITSAIAGKCAQVQGWLERGVVRETDVLLLAISGARLGMNAMGENVSPAEKAVYGIGYEAFEIGQWSRQVKESYRLPQEVVQKLGTPGQNPIEIPTTSFCGPGIPWLSALIWSPFWEFMSQEGANVQTLHNPFARSKLSTGFFDFGHECFPNISPEGERELTKRTHHAQ